ncbi:hypothetical protein ILUMI_11770 [Ignelater luminosus]|uniref:RNA methyltransferase n=1 Tax=Ignelater luminosus TaxID=2038154 RepID=A0A8K0GCE9_IGNLU|nr:hypothetical protein ILUMI_11770 [Ignelater luminosus]
MNNLNFRGENPGAVQYGNFINYYQFHPPENRINLLPETIWNTDKTFVGLDIGCNAGNLTLMLYEFLTKIIKKPCYILGIDIDPILIERANEENSNDNIKFICLDFMDSKNRDALISEYLASHGVNKFSAIFCFSLTMWIHLNHGDSGLLSFLQQICTLSEMVIIEPQPWKCYRAAVKRMKQNNEEFPEYKKLKIRNDIENTIENVLLNCCNGVSKILETERTGWDRKVLFFNVVKS